MDNLRKMALYTQLEDGYRWEDFDIANYDDKTVVVNGRVEYSGTSPKQIMADAEYAHSLLAQIDLDANTIIGIVEKYAKRLGIENIPDALRDTKNLTSLKREAYNYFASCFKEGKTKRTDDSDNPHRETNLVYNLLWYHDKVELGEYGKHLQDAFEGETIEEYRRKYPTSDYEFLVVTDEEADELWDEYLEGCLDDEGIASGASSPYFDREAWKEDARGDGRAHSLASYDGEEYEVFISEEKHPYLFYEDGASADDTEGEECGLLFYLYRTN